MHQVRDVDVVPVDVRTKQETSKHLIFLLRHSGKQFF